MNCIRAKFWSFNSHRHRLCRDAIVRSANCRSCICFDNLRFYYSENAIKKIRHQSTETGVNNWVTRLHFNINYQSIFKYSHVNYKFTWNVAYTSQRNLGLWLWSFKNSELSHFEMHQWIKYCLFRLWFEWIKSKRYKHG